MTIYDYYKRSGWCCAIIFLFVAFSGANVDNCPWASLIVIFYWFFFLCRWIYYKVHDAQEVNKEELNDKYIEQIKKDRARENKIEKEYGTIDYQEKHYK